MFEMDKESFGQFLAQHRKEQGMTQKQLAERLFVSDKAVSKWERGLSLPDVSLLLPLSQLLGVSVTELLEGRQLEEPMAPEEVETLVQKALQYPEIPPEVQRLQRRRRLCIYLGAAAIALTECVVLYFAFGMQMLPEGLTLELLAMIFGGFFWLGMPQRLPAYYDQERIAYFAHNGMHMHLPGIYYNNRNWPHILRSLRGWSLAAMVLSPLAAGALLALQLGDGAGAGHLLLLVVFLGSLVAAVAVPSRRYEFVGEQPPTEQSEEKFSRRRFLGGAVLMLVLGLLCICLLGGGRSRSAVQLMYTETVDRHHWSAQYQYFDGWMQHSLTPAQEGQSLQIQGMTQSGRLSVQVTDQEGRTLFEQQELKNGLYTIPVQGRVKVRLTGKSHQGGFWIGYREE